MQLNVYWCIAMHFFFIENLVLNKVEFWEEFVLQRNTILIKPGTNCTATVLSSLHEVVV